MTEPKDGILAPTKTTVWKKRRANEVAKWKRAVVIQDGIAFAQDGNIELSADVQTREGRVLAKGTRCSVAWSGGSGTAILTPWGERQNVGLNSFTVSVFRA